MTTTWSLGEYPIMAQRLEPVAHAAVDVADIAPGENALDVATGTGNAALLAATRSANVIGVDSDEGLLRVALDRTTSRTPVRWQLGDAAALPVDDDWADVVLSTFGVMYATDHDAAARELARCTRATGRIVLASWTPDSFLPAFGRVVAPYLPPPPAASSPPSRWGDERALQDLLHSVGLVVVETRTMTLDMTFDDVAGAADFLIRTAGHVLAERSRLARTGRWHELRSDVERLVRTERHGTSGVHLDCDYLLTTAKVAGAPGAPEMSATMIR